MVPGIKDGARPDSEQSITAQCTRERKSEAEESNVNAQAQAQAQAR